MEKDFTLKQIKITIIVLTFSIGVISCGKKWKETTKVNFKFLVTKDSLLQSKQSYHIGFYAATMVLGDFNFSGDRNQGGAVAFSNASNQGTILNLMDGTALPAAICYDIPQGIYKNIAITVNAIKKDTTPSIVLSGYFMNDNKNSPLIFELNANQIYTITSQTATGSGQIVLVTGTPATCEITFNITYWFGTVTEDAMEDAYKVDINGVSTILINENTNEDIYNLIVARIGQSTTAIFK